MLASVVAVLWAIWKEVKAFFCRSLKSCVLGSSSMGGSSSICGLLVVICFTICGVGSVRSGGRVIGVVVGSFGS